MRRNNRVDKLFDIERNEPKGGPTQPGRSASQLDEGACKSKFLSVDDF